MSIMDSLLTFSLAAVLLTLTPGLDTALILRTATTEGKNQAIQAALGINTGCLLWGVAVAFGLGSVVAVSELAYDILKYCGAAYLGWLGICMLVRPRKQLIVADASNKTASNWFLKGVLGNALNPKVGIFYVSFLPQFIPQGHSPVIWTFGLVTIHITMGIVWSLMLIGATRPLASLLRKEKVIRWLDRTTGLVFLLFAARLAISRR
ncbi:lysine transporter LysE (plasmid) [Duffyella gerundensis]|uniref:Lysine transporter LysE n=1 Tax=Duffyella gerundensis TaxID=1619313 RepID=A0A0U5GSR6_9GAMM|nr:LysE family translocator [Duffyella gerundensis]CUU25921.1 lysine transporter LysE [Duffyella gerundensis]